MMLYRVLMVLLLCCFSGSGLLATAGRAADAASPLLFRAGDFPLESGAVIRDMELAYVTQGRLNAAADNAVLLCTAFMADHRHTEGLVGAGRAFDPKKYFIVTVNAFGNGRSSSPSTSRQQPGPAFPQCTLRDMVRAQHLLLTQELGVHRLAVAGGISMGGMQALQWAVSFPAMVHDVVALVPATRTSDWTRRVNELLRQCIMSDPAWQQGNYSVQPQRGLRLMSGLLFGLLVQTPASVQGQPLSALLSVQEAAWNIMDANDIIYQTRAFDSFSLGGAGGRAAQEVALRSIRARTLLLYGKNDVLCPEEELLHDAALLPAARVLAIGPQSGHGAGTGNAAETLAWINREILRFLAGEMLSLSPAAAR